MTSPPEDDVTTTNHEGRNYRHAPSLIPAGAIIEAATNNNKNGNSFPLTLHYMLREVEIDGHSNLISWQPHGRCLMVHRPKEFTKTLLPCWFRQSKYTSFQRQLNIYGFRRITIGRDKGGYYHECFLRGRTDLCRHIQRIKVKGTKTRRPSSPGTEPNFYLLPFLIDNDIMNKTNTNKSLAATKIQSSTNSTNTSGNDNDIDENKNGIIFASERSSTIFIPNDNNCFTSNHQKQIVVVDIDNDQQEESYRDYDNEKKNLLGHPKKSSLTDTNNAMRSHQHKINLNVAIHSHRYSFVASSLRKQWINQLADTSGL